MDNIEAYSFLFSDSFFSGLFIMLRKPFVADTMRILGTYNYYLIYIFALLGNIMANAFSYALGIALVNSLKAKKRVPKDPTKLSKFLNKNLLKLNLFNFFNPLGSLTMFYNGFKKENFKLAMLYSSLSHVFYQAYLFWG